MTVTPAFALHARTPVSALGLVVEDWRHPCGARHLHLATADEHRAFCVAFRTPPGDDTGLPHILEHTTLCGSRRYPVRDPFFAMTRRSLQTFMNAMTYPDLTAYPFASQVAKDFSNLLDVYLDAVFAPNLDPLDFAQEGHRLAPKPDGAWERTGVVFNEMKGALDDSAAQMNNATTRALLPATIYAFESGGEPAAIPGLTREDLVAFHRRCYRPANAVFLTYGSFAPADLHARLVPYLAEPGAALPPPTLQPPLTTPQTAAVPVPWAEGQDPADVASASLTWALGDSADLDEALTMELIERLLLGHAGAPLRRTLEGCGLGRGTGGTGYQASYRNGLFSCELDGILPDDQEKLPPLVLDALTGIARDGVPESEVAAALHQIELSRREIHGDHYPYGLELLLRLVGPWNHGVDPLPFLDQAPAIARLSAAARTPGWLGREIHRRFLDNPHRIFVRGLPDRAWHGRRQQAEDAATAAAVAALDDAGKATLATQAAALEKRQAQRDDPKVLPDLELADVPKERRWATGQDHAGVTTYTAGTNGILHLVAVLPLPELSDREMDLLPLAVGALGRLGAAGRDFASLAGHLTAVSGGLWARSDLAANPHDPTRITGSLTLEVKGLTTRAEEFLPLLHQVLATTTGDEAERLAEIIDQGLAHLQDRVTSGGTQFASLAALRGLPGAAGLGHRTSGLGRLAWLKTTADRLEADDHAAPALGAEVTALLRRLANAPAKLAVIGDHAERSEVLTSVRTAWPTLATPPGSRFAPPIPLPVTGPTAYTTSTQVNYCALAFAGPALTDPDAPALAVAGRLLTNLVLHPKLREKGGAYGGYASYSSGNGSFLLGSYRDPRLEATYADMREALAWLADVPDDARALKEAILGAVGSLDAPGSPAGEARSRFLGEARGTTPALLDAYRARLLTTTTVDIRRAAARWLPQNGGHQAVICSPEAAARLGWTTYTI